MRASQYSHGNPSRFVAAKADAAIPVAHELVGDALIQAALDPAVRAIEFVPTVATVAGPVALGALVLHGAAGYVLRLHRRAQLPGDDIAREVIEDRAEIEPAPAGHLRAAPRQACGACFSSPTSFADGYPKSCLDELLPWNWAQLLGEERTSNTNPAAHRRTLILVPRRAVIGSWRTCLFRPISSHLPD